MPLRTDTPLSGNPRARLFFFSPRAGHAQGGGNAQGDDGGEGEGKGEPAAAGWRRPRMRSNGEHVYRIAFHAMLKAAPQGGDDSGPVVIAQAVVMFDIPTDAPAAARKDPGACGGQPLYDVLSAAFASLTEPGGLLDWMPSAACSLGAVRGLIAGGVVAVRVESMPKYVRIYWMVDLATRLLAEAVPEWVPLHWGLPGGAAALAILRQRQLVEQSRALEHSLRWAMESATDPGSRILMRRVLESVQAAGAGPNGNEEDEGEALAAAFEDDD